jgi:hypothetical protein
MSDQELLEHKAGQHDAIKATLLKLQIELDARLKELGDMRTGHAASIKAIGEAHQKELQVLKARVQELEAEVEAMRNPEYTAMQKRHAEELAAFKSKLGVK